jgi:hypothetical protein
MLFGDRAIRRPANIIREEEVGGPVYTLFDGRAVRYHRLPNGGHQILDINDV